MSSIGGKLGVPHLLPYVLSKFALAGLSEALSAELVPDDIFVTTVYPGLMRTGSHVNAFFKGNTKAEFAWFSIAASFPLASMNARRAARKILEASRRKQRRLVITTAARAATIAETLMPSTVAHGLRWMNRWLPANPSVLREESRTGWESRSRWAPSLLTRLADRAITRNNEQRSTA